MITALEKQLLSTIKKEGKRKVILLAGATGVGKTRVSLAIASAIGGEIISADSMQFYKGMDIGTAKIRPEERQGIEHHLIDSRELEEHCNVVDFFYEAQEALKKIFLRGAVPIVVGGSGLYLHSLIYGPPQTPPSVPLVRRRIEEEADRYGIEKLYQHLLSLDPLYGATISSRDHHKIVRALEIIEVGQQQVSSFKKRESPLIDAQCWFLYSPLEQLYSILDQRCDKMIEDGLIGEVALLKEKGLERNPTASRAIGYRQGLAFLDSSRLEPDWTLFITDFKRATRRYAKRQYTWFRKEPLFRWINIGSVGENRTIETIIQDYEKN